HADASGSASGRVVIAGEPTSVALDLRFLGSVANIPARVTAALRGDAIAATADVPDASAAAIRALIPAYPIDDAASAHVEVEGDLGAIRARARVASGREVVDADAKISITAGKLTGVAGEADVAEPGAPTHVTFDVSPEGGSFVADFVARTRVADLRAIRRVGP